MVPSGGSNERRYSLRSSWSDIGIWYCIWCTSNRFRLFGFTVSLRDAIGYGGEYPKDLYVDGRTPRKRDVFLGLHVVRNELFL
jgi:hypothetical protein